MSRTVNSRPITDPRQLQIICAAMIAANAIYVVIAYVLDSTGALADIRTNTGLDERFAHFLLAVGLIIVATSFALKRLLMVRLPRPAEMQRIAGVYIISTGLAEGAGAIGLVVVLLTGQWVHAGILWGVGFGAGIIHFPTRAQLDNLRGAAA